MDYFISTGGSGGDAHAAMFAATSNNPDFYDYQIEAGAVGVYKNEDGSYSTAVTIDGVDYEISDGAWGCIAYSAITPLYEADMALAFEYFLDTEYSFKTPFQKQLAEYLSASYMEYINGQNLSVQERDIGFDLDGDGELNSIVALTIEYDIDNHADTNGYYGTYLDLYLAEFNQNLQWYLDNLDYSEGWIWFDEDGNALSDGDVAVMTGEDDTDDPTWTKIVMGASEGDMSMFNSLNLQIAWLNADVDAEIEWQWDGGHVPSEALGNSFSLYADQMYGEYVDEAVNITKPAAIMQTENGTAESATGKDISSWVSYADTTAVSFTLADIAAYRTSGASKAMPGFDVIDYGQEDYVFGNPERDARHWNMYLLEVFEEYTDILEPMFNQ